MVIVFLSQLVLSWCKDLWFWCCYGDVCKDSELWQLIRAMEGDRGAVFWLWG